MRLVRRRVTFSGRVQGVGFRFTCMAVARGFAVAGYVRNLADGRVELAAEGGSSVLDDFLNAIQLEMSAYITDVTTESLSPGSDPFTGFSIRH
ncbi:MAG: acylphosphatase [Isosphaerales bacterium]